MHTPLIQAHALRDQLAAGAAMRIFDCSFDLMNPSAGAQAFAEQHLPGASHANIERDLSQHQAGAPKASGGRHPLPTQEAFSAWLQAQGVRADTPVVVYDRNGNNYCGRLWWMLKWCGHPAVAVLDGGLAAWLALGGATESGLGAAPTASAEPYPLRPSGVRLVDGDAVAAALGSPEQTLLDARASARFEGRTEPLDPVAGHIPGALNRPFSANFESSGRFKPAEVLAQEFQQLLAHRPAQQVVHQCGSGVSAVANLLAMEIAGLGGSALYAGSWSEWSRHGGRPCAQSAG